MSTTAPWPDRSPAWDDVARSLPADLSDDGLDAYQFVSQNAVAPVVEIVDPLYTVLVKIPKARLPK